jgi:prepilin-type N-terminal cleavage/methylation domain-containing protein
VIAIKLLEQPALKLRATAITKDAGFSIVEVLVSLVLLGVLVLVTTGFLTPLRLTRNSALQSSALSYARSYMELAKSKWQSDASAFQANQLADGGSDGTPDGILLKYPAGMTSSNIAVTSTVPANGTIMVRQCPNPSSIINCVTVAKTSLRRIRITVTPPDNLAPIILETMVVSPS